MVDIDGERSSTLEEFLLEVCRAMNRDVELNLDMDSFHEILQRERRDDGRTHGRIGIRWKNSAIAKELLSYPETVRQLQRRLRCCHPTGRNQVAAELARAVERQGPTVFDWIVEAVGEHGPSGSEPEDDTVLELH